jgi:hypothetical protein
MDVVTTWFNSVPLDWFILAIFCTIILIDALRGSTVRAAAVAIAFPIAAILFSYLADTAYLGAIAAAEGYVPAIVFLGLTIGIFVFAYRMMGWGDSVRPPQAVMGAVGATVVAVSVWLSIDALEALWNFGPLLDSVFGDTYRLFWIVGGLALAALSRK